MPEYKLIYFNGRGLAELVRWIFLQGDIPFTDERVDREDWPERKKTIPGGRLPILMVDGKPLWQSQAIARYAASLSSLMPKDLLNAAYCDAFAESVKELATDMFKIKRSDKSEEEKEKEIKEEYIPKVLEPFMEKINKRMSEKQWLVSDNITWADLAYGRIMEEMLKEFSAVLKKYPVAVAHAEKVHNLPKIKEWRAKRPETPF